MQLYLLIQKGVKEGQAGQEKVAKNEKEAEKACNTPCLHFVETAQSALREMPQVKLIEPMVGVHVCSRVWCSRRGVEVLMSLAREFKVVAQQAVICATDFTLCQ